jgi:hypothetical protein
MSHLTAFDNQDLKLVYRTLHGQLLESPELMDSPFLNELQLWLQTLARVEGVDISDHAQWDRWLGRRSAGCASR